MIEQLRKKQIEKEVELICDSKIKIEDKSIELRDIILNALQPYFETPTQESFFTMVGALSSCLYTISSLFFQQDELDEALEELGTILTERIIPDLNIITPCGKCIDCLNSDFENCKEPNFDPKLTRSHYIVLLASRLLDNDSYIKNVSNKILNFVTNSEEADMASQLLLDRINKEQEDLDVK